MRLTFIMMRRGHVRHFASTIEGLLARGHEVDIGFDDPDSTPTGIEERLAKRYPTLTWDTAPRRQDRWVLFLLGVRAGIDLIRYAHPDYRNSGALRGRIEAKARRQCGRLIRFVTWILKVRSAWLVRLVVRMLSWLQFKLPVAEPLCDYLRHKSPDVLIVTPLVAFGSHLVDYMQAADRLGIPSIAAIASWDNLTNKGLLRCCPDRVLVWNKPQCVEATRYHYVPPDRVVATGAHIFDRWLGRTPRRSREEFLARIGLDPDVQYVAFLCSSGFIARGEEADFVRRWVASIRTAGIPRLANLGVLVRPHFQNAVQWADQNLSDLDNVVVYPAAGANPVKPDSEEDYFDTLYYSAAVIGINTTAMIEAGLIGRPVMTIETDFASTQGGSLHFRHLVDGGLLLRATSMDAHIRQLADTLERPPPPEANEPFVDFFIRSPDPHRSATEVMLDEIETVAVLEKSPAVAGWTDRIVQAMFYPLARRLPAMRLRAKHKGTLARKAANVMKEKPDRSASRLQNDHSGREQGQPSRVTE